MTALSWTWKDVWSLRHWFTCNGLSVSLCLIGKTKENCICFWFQFDKRPEFIFSSAIAWTCVFSEKLILRETIFRGRALRMWSGQECSTSWKLVYKRAWRNKCLSFVLLPREGTEKVPMRNSLNWALKLPQTSHSSKTQEISCHPQLPLLKDFVTATRMLTSSLAIEFENVG